MRVLFVDDEEMILRGIERKLFHRSDDWDICCVTSGADALEELEDERFDVVVSDMRMPGMDGAALLCKVHELYPHMIRIVLSGYAEVEATMRAVPVTHQFLAKPCAPDLIEDVINRAMLLQKLLDGDELRTAVGEVGSLPSLPKVYAELTAALADEGCDLDRVTSVVVKDPAMCAKLLQLVNSSFFTRGASIADARQAVLRLGFEMVKNLALAAEVFSVGKLPRKLRERLSLDALQRHAMTSATVASSIIGSGHAADDAFMAAMLQDAGLLVLASEMPDKLLAALELAAAEDIPQHEAERRVFGTSHAEVGAYLLGTWGLPYGIVDAVANHHTPERAPSRTFGLVEAVHVASELVAGREPGPDYLAERGVSDRIVEWRAIAGAALEKAS